jgi:hypothetical protein
VSSVWVAFACGVFLGAFVGMFALALAIIAGRSGEAHERIMEHHEAEETDVASLDGFVRFRVPGRKPLYVPTGPETESR